MIQENEVDLVDEHEEVLGFLYEVCRRYHLGKKSGKPVCFSSNTFYNLKARTAKV